MFTENAVEQLEFQTPLKNPSLSICRTPLSPVNASAVTAKPEVPKRSPTKRALTFSPVRPADRVQTSQETPSATSAVSDVAVSPSKKSKDQEFTEAATVKRTPARRLFHQTQSNVPKSPATPSNRRQTETSADDKSPISSPGLHLSSKFVCVTINL